MEKIAEVIINNSSRQLSKVFHYKVCGDIEQDIRVGQVVNVPFGKGNKITQAYIVGFIDSSPFTDLKYIEEIVLKDDIGIKTELLSLAFWMSKEYMCSIADCIRLMLPPAGTKKLTKNKKDKNPLKDKHIERTFPFAANHYQKTAINKIREDLINDTVGRYLIHGVTGSGKTEVYLQLIAEAINLGKQAIVLVPEISLTPQMIQRFVGRFGSEVAVLHSRLSEGERKDQWYRINEGTVKVVVGARSAVFAPFDNLGIIIIDEEHEHTYKSENTPKYHAKNVAFKRGEFEKCVVVLGSATPAVETYYSALKGDISLLELPQRANNSCLPEAEIVDMRKELESGNRSILSKALYDAIIENIKSGNQTILFLNKRGYSSFVLCRGCGYVVKCKNCNISLTYHIKGDRLICHYCGYNRPNISVCPKCGGKQIRHFGIGTQKVEEEIKRIFPTASVLRMDMDTTTRKNSHEEILRKFSEEKVNILIGTQMIAKGHDFPDVTLVGVISADLMLNLEDFRSTEKTFQLLTQVAGRAGRAEKSGRVIIQTYEIDNFSIKTAKKQDYNEFYDQEIIIRNQLKYPPFCDIVSILVSGVDEEKVKEAVKGIEVTLIRELSAEDQDINVLNAIPAPVARIKNRFRWRIIIKCKANAQLKQKLELIVRNFAHKYEKSCSIGIDVNPQSIM